MASVVASVDQFDATVTVPDDGDTRSAASVTAAGVGFQPLTNRTDYLRTRLLPSAGWNVALPLIPNDATNWTYTAASVWSTVTLSETFDIELPSQQGALLVSMTAHHIPSAGSFGASGTLAKLTLYSVNATTGVRSSVATVTDPAANAAAYDTGHSFTLTLGAPRAFAPTTERLVLQFTNDDGGGTTMLLTNLRMNLSPVV